MKNSKYYIFSAIAALVMSATSCKTQKNAFAWDYNCPDGKTVTKPVTGWAYDNDGTQNTVAIKVHGREVLVHKYPTYDEHVDSSLPEYAIGDSISINFNKNVRKYHEAYAEQIVR